MKKSGLIVIFAFVMISFLGFVLADTNCSTHGQEINSNVSCCIGLNQTSSHCCNSTIGGIWNGNSCVKNITTATPSSTTPENSTKIEKAFSCLKTQVKTNCSGATNIQDIALTILASPSGVTQSCFDKLKKLKKTNNCFGDTVCTIKDTALAILALNHVGENTDVYETWLMNQNKTTSDLVWYLEQDSNEKTTCKISYNSADYTITAQENKKLEGQTGNCLSPANSNFWLSISPSCYSTDFTIACEKNFIATLLYKATSSSVYHILSDTKTAAPNQPITLSVESSCLGIGSNCDYEGTAWAALALKTTGNSINKYLPYLIGLEDTNRQYLPYAFLNLLVSYSEYGTKLIQQQQISNWEADLTAHDKFYDTALALISINNPGQTQIKNARDWLLNTAQQTTGCWNNNDITDTAFILWALEGRISDVRLTGTTGCIESGFSCTPSRDCSLSNLLSNYACNSIGDSCCKATELKTCDTLLGTICDSNLVCNGEERKASDSSQCCLADCVVPTPIDNSNSCSNLGGTCKSSCSSGEDAVSGSCESDLSCCRQSSSTGGSWAWLWILLILLIILIILAIIYREQLKIWYFKLKSKFKKEDKSPKPPFPNNTGFPPRPGFPPITRPTMPNPRIGAGPIQRPNLPVKGKSSSDMDDVLSRLKKISGK